VLPETLCPFDTPSRHHGVMDEHERRDWLHRHGFVLYGWDPTHRTFVGTWDGAEVLVQLDHVHELARREQEAEAA
jgi:hypothetical protein